MSVTHLWLGQALGQAGLLDDAVATYEAAVRLAPKEPLGIAFLAHGLAVAGDTVAARGRLAELEAMRKGRYVSAYDLAVIRVGLGELDAALALLERGLEERTHWMARPASIPGSIHSGRARPSAGSWTRCG
jgi:Flp pilus assembly protein TadD